MLAFLVPCILVAFAHYFVVDTNVKCQAYLEHLLLDDASLVLEYLDHDLIECCVSLATEKRMMMMMVMVEMDDDVDVDNLFCCVVNFSIVVGNCDAVMQSTRS